jgi:glycine C-acetyltransferase
MPSIAAASLSALDLLEESSGLREQLKRNASRFRAAMTDAGFDLAGSGHPIIPVMLGDATLATEMAQRLLRRGIYVIGFSYPVVPLGKARIRTQMSAAHRDDHIDRAVAAFVEVGWELGVVA